MKSVSVFLYHLLFACWHFCLQRILILLSRLHCFGSFLYSSSFHLVLMIHEKQVQILVKELVALVYLGTAAAATHLKMAGWFQFQFQ